MSTFSETALQKTITKNIDEATNVNSLVPLVIQLGNKNIGNLKEFLKHQILKSDQKTKTGENLKFLRSLFLNTSNILEIISSDVMLKVLFFVHPMEMHNLLAVSKEMHKLIQDDYGNMFQYKKQSHSRNKQYIYNEATH